MPKKRAQTAAKTPASRQAGQAAQNSDMNIGRMLDAIISDKIPGFVAKNNEGIISEIKKMLGYYKDAGSLEQSDRYAELIKEKQPILHTNYIKAKEEYNGVVEKLRGNQTYNNYPDKGKLEILKGTLNPKYIELHRLCKTLKGLVLDSALAKAPKEEDKLSLGKLLKKVINKDQPSTFGKGCAPVVVELQEMLKYYGGGSYSAYVKTIMDKVTKLGLIDTEEYKNFNGQYLVYNDTTISELLNDDTVPGATAKENLKVLIVKLQENYTKLVQREEKLQRKILEAETLLQKEEAQKLPIKELIIAIKDGNAPDNVDKKVAADLKPILIYYGDKNSYVNELTRKIKVLGLSNLSEWNMFRAQCGLYNRTINDFESSDRSGKTVAEDVNDLEEVLNSVYEDVHESEQSLNKKIKENLLSQYEKVCTDLRTVKTRYFVGKEELAKQVKVVEDATVVINNKRMEFDKLSVNIAKVKPGTKQHNNLTGSVNKLVEQISKLAIEYVNAWEKLNELYQLVLEGPANQPSLSEQYELLSKKQQELAKLILSEGVAKEAELRSLQKEVGFEKLDDFQKEIGSLEQRYKEAKEKVPSRLKAFTTKLLRQKDRVSRHAAIEEKKEIERQLEKAKISQDRWQDISASDSDKQIRYMHRGEISKQDFEKEKRQLEADAEKIRNAQISSGSISVEESNKRQKEERSAQAKQCLNMCDQNIKVLDGILKMNPKGFPFIGQKYNILGEIMDDKDNTAKAKLERFYKDKYVTILFKALDQLFGDKGIMQQLADSPFTDPFPRRYGFVNLAANIGVRYRQLKLVIYDKALIKKFEKQTPIDSAQSEKLLKGVVDQLHESAKSTRHDLDRMISQMEQQLQQKNPLGFMSGLKNKSKLFLRSGARTNDNLQLLEDIKRQLSDKYQKFDASLLAFNKALEGKESLQGKLSDYADIVKGFSDLVVAISYVIPSVAGAFASNLNLIAVTLKVVSGVTKRMGLNYVWGPSIIAIQNKIKQNCNEMFGKINEAYIIYKKTIADGKEGLVWQQQALEEGLSEVIAVINGELLDFSATCRAEGGKYRQPPLNLHISSHMRALYKVKAKFIELITNLMDVQGFQSLPPELQIDNYRG